MNLIKPNALVDIAGLLSEAGTQARCDLIYADAAHPLNQTFAEAIYRPGAKMWMHRDLAEIVVGAAKAAQKAGLRLVLTDCLRTTDAQARMCDTALVRANPHWLEDGPRRLLSPPGAGAHPRGMAVDVMLETPEGQVLDMGTALDHFSTDPEDNPAARDYPMPAHVKRNRAMLDAFMLDAACACGRALVPLPSEWWDYRFPPEIYGQYAPLSDADLPADMRMCS